MNAKNTITAFTHTPISYPYLHACVQAYFKCWVINFVEYNKKNIILISDRYARLSIRYTLNWCMYYFSSDFKPVMTLNIWTFAGETDRFLTSPEWQ